MFSVNGSLEEMYKVINVTKCWYLHLNKRLFAWVEYFQNLYKSIAYCNMDLCGTRKKVCNDDQTRTFKVFEKGRTKQKVACGQIKLMWRHGILLWFYTKISSQTKIYNGASPRRRQTCLNSETILVLHLSNTDL